MPKLRRDAGPRVTPDADIDGDEKGDLFFMQDGVETPACVFLGASLPTSGVVNADEADIHFSGDVGESYGTSLGWTSGDLDGDGLTDLQVGQTAYPAMDFIYLASSLL